MLLFMYFKSEAIIAEYLAAHGEDGGKYAGCWKIPLRTLSFNNDF